MLATDQISALGPRFRLPYEALSAIRAQRGSGPMLEHALATNDAPTRLVALMLEDAKLALVLMGDLVTARASGKKARITRARKRLDKALAKLAAKSETASSREGLGRER